MRRPRKLKQSRGAAAVEFALVLPLLLTLLLGVWDFGRLVEVDQILTNAAREAGRQVSTAQGSTSAVQQVVTNYMARSGISTTGMTITVTNLTSSSRNDPTTAQQLDQYQLVVTLPSNNVRLVLLNNLLGTSTLKASITWLSMADIPLNVSSTIPTS